LERNYFTPRGLVHGAAAQALVARGDAWALCGGPAVFALGEVTHVVGETVSSSLSRPTTISSELTSRRAAFAGLDISQPQIMGVLNVTPDSFSDGGKYVSVEAAIAHGVALLEAGAEIIDVGGESTRPGAVPVDPADESARVIPVVKALTARGAKISIDTRHAKVMSEAIAVGAAIVNDVSALSDPAALDVIARSSACVVLMHMQGQPKTMQNEPSYVWAPGDVFDFLKARVAMCMAKGIGLERLSIDPGIGFGKTDVHNAAIIDHLAMFHGLGCVLSFGASRKGFIGRMSRGEGPEARLPGSLAAALMAAQSGAQVIRVHDVAETRQVLALWRRLRAG
jgi:dihydropteroate synthase